MDVNALRTWGIVASTALIAVALSLSLTASEPLAQTAPPEPPAFEIAQTDVDAAAPVAFLVRFRGDGPIARSQGAAARGQIAAAQREIEAQLIRQTAFNGLCFDRFTVGAAEVVLATCEAPATHERASVQQRWLARLQAMRAVEYVDANATASRDRAG